VLGYDSMNEMNESAVI